MPRAYLERFGPDRVAVRRRDGTAFVASTVNVALEIGLYDVTDADGKRSPVIENALGQVDSDAIDVLREIDKTQTPPAPDTLGRATLARYLAIQLTRTPAHRERVLFPRRVAEHAGEAEVTRAVVEEYLRTVHLGFPPSSSEVEAAWQLATFALQDPAGLTPESATRLMLASVTATTPVVETMTWTLEVDRKARFLTSDLPLVIWRAPSPRDAVEGVGLENCDEVRFPVDPSSQLVLSRRSRAATARVGRERVAACNQDLADGCTQFILGPSAEALTRVRLAARGPRIRFNIASGVEVGPDGSRRPIGDVLHTWVPRR